MNKYFRFVSLGMAFAVMLAVGTVVNAQDPCEDYDTQGALYTRFTENMGGDLAKRKIAVAAGKEYLEKYGNCPASKDIVDYLKSYLPTMETAIKNEEIRIADAAMFKRYDAAFESKNYSEAYAAGRDILAKFPDNINVMLPLGLIGLYESYEKNFAFNDNTLNYARQSIAKLKGDPKTDKKNDQGEPVYGVFQFERTKDDAISELTYAIAYITYHVKNDKKGALNYYYEVSQLPGQFKNEPRVYQTIGSFYLDDVNRLSEEIAGLIKQINETEDIEQKEAIDKTVKERIALFNGYVERAMDGYIRAHNVAGANEPAGYKDGLYKMIQSLYERRFDKKDGMEAYISSVTSKPLPNPNTEVTPVAEPANNAESSAAASTASGAN